MLENTFGQLNLMTKLTGNVLVLGHGERAFLSVIRSLGRAGLNVHVAMCAPEDLALKSRYVDRWHDVPEYQPGTGTWLQAMERIVSETPFQLVIPCEDQAVIPLQIHRERLERHCRLYTLTDHAFQVAFSKIKSYELAKTLGIPQPRSEILDEVFRDEVVENFSLPVIVKPPSSFTSADTSAKRSVVRCRTRAELSEKLSDVKRWGAGLIQENFIGTGVGVELLACNGDVLVAFQHIRIHEPLEGGGSSYRCSAKLSPLLLAASKALMKELEYTGVAMVEFKQNFDTGQFVFVEINGRFWGSLPLAIAAGVDFPRFLYEMLIHDRREYPRDYRVPIFCRNVASDQRWLRENFAADKSDPLLATRSLRSVAAEIKHILLFRERWDTLTIGDPFPGVADLMGIGFDAIGKLCKVCRRHINQSAPIRKRRRSRVLAIAQTARNILFVCKGNICRSPFAELYSREHLPANLTLQSCGYYPASGRSSPELAQQVALKFGVDESAHRSRIINDELVQQADLIFTFDEHNLATILDRFPTASGRVFALRSVCDSGPDEVADPYNGSASDFDLVFTQISEAIDRLSGVFRPEHLEEQPPRIEPTLGSK